MTDEVFGEDVDLTKVETPADETTEPVPQPEGKIPEPPPIKEEPKSVPLAALLEERKEWKQRYSELEDKLNKGNERLEKLVSSFQEKPQEPPQFEQDPLGHLRHNTETVSKELQEFRKWKGDFEQTNKQQAEFQRFQAAVSTAEADFAKETPDYWDAAQHVVKSQREMLELLGVPKEHLDSALHRQLAGIAYTSLQTGKNPAQVTYELAKRHGYQGKKSQTDMTTLQKGIEAAKSVPSGRDNEVSLSIESLAKLDDEEFDRLVDDPKAWSKLGRAA